MVRSVIQAIRYQIGGAALDVTVPAPSPRDHGLWKLDNNANTTHLGSATEPAPRDLLRGEGYGLPAWSPALSEVELAR